MTIQKERTCQEDGCNKSLPTSAYPHRKYCDDCQKERIARRHQTHV